MYKLNFEKILKHLILLVILGSCFTLVGAQHRFRVDAEGTDYYIKFTATGIWKNHCDCDANNTKIYGSKSSFGGSDRWFTGSISGSSTSYDYTHVVGPSSGYKSYYIRVRYTGKKKWAGTCVFPEDCARNVDANGVISTRTSAIKKPKNVSATDEEDDTYIDITWEKGTDIPNSRHKYKIYRNTTLIATVNGDVRNYRDDGLKPGKKYTYRVTTFTNDFSTGDHESSKYASGVYDEGSTFSMGLKASDSEYTNRTLLRWNDVSDKADEIEVSRIDGTDTVQIDVVSKYAKSFSDYDGIPGYQYTYMVRPVKVGVSYEPDFDNGTMKENGRIKGKVVSPLSAGVSGVVVYGEATVDENGTTKTKTYTDTTDASGYYELVDLYYYKKGDFKVYPGKFKHAFTPDTVIRTLDVDNPKLASVDFTDTTVFTVNGVVGYPIISGSSTASCGIQGAKVLLNGNAIAQTDAQGKYSFVVQDEGTYNIKVEYLHHQFNVHDTDIFIADNVLGLDFIDIETDTLKIKVQGGCNTSLADSVEVRIRATQDQACFDRKVYTNASGNIELILPAQEYKVEVTDLFPVNSNIFYQIGNKPITIDLTVRDSTTLYDTTYTVDTIATEIIVLPDGSRDTIPGYYDTTATTYDSSQQAVLPRTDFIYRAPISIIVNWDEAAEKMVCMPKHGGGNETVPLMETGGRYELLIDVRETVSGCPVREGEIRLYDYVADLDKKAQILQIKDGRAKYNLNAGSPKIASGGQHPHQKLFYMLADVGFLDPVPYEEWVLVTGSQARDQTFITRSAGIPFVVLHDPPGDKSYSYIEKGSTFSTFTRTESVFGGYGGIKVESNAGGGMKTPFSSTKVGWAADLEITAGRDNNWKAGTVTTMTFRERFTTSDAELMTGYPGDVFVGAAYNMIYSLADAIDYDAASCGIVRDTILLMDPVGFATTFIYTEDFLKTVLIPNLKELKKLAPTDSAAVLQVDIDNWEKILSDNEKNRDENAEKLSDDEGFSNISISSGTAYENEYTYDTTVSGSYEYQAFINTNVFLGFAGENLSGFWAKFKAGVVANIKHSYTSEEGNDTTRSRVVGYHIEDNDRGDYHSIDILKDKANGVPAFRLVSGATSCPHEPNTQRRYLGEIEIYPPERTNVPSDGKANFTVSLMNNSQSDETQTYQIQVLQESNVDGAIVNLAGSTINHSPVSFALPPRQLVQVKLTVERGPLASTYKGLKLRIAAGCEVDGKFKLVSADTVSFDVEFQSDCSTVGIYRPVENWIINSSHGDYLDMAFTNYDANDPNLESLILEYRKEGKGWEEAVEIPKDSLIQKFYDVKVLTKNWSDGLYQLRAMANCRSTISQVQYSDIVNGKIDRAPVALFGVPYPSDGILNVGDEIMVEFDQHIDKSIAYLPGGFALQRDDDKSFLPIKYTINEGKLIITTTPASLLDSLEGVKINAIVSNVEDLSGNILSEPIVWSFVVNRSPVYWTKRNIDYAVERGNSGSFDATLTNVGGVDASFTIVKYPSWLVPSTLVGTVSGLGGTQDVTFGITPGLFPGTYTDTVVATSGSYNLLLLVKVEVLATAPSWVTSTFDPAQFKYNMNAILQFSTDDSDASISSDTRDVIGVFNGNQLVGKGSIQYVPGLRRYLAFVTIYSDTTDSDSLHFRMWDPTPGVHYLAKETTLFKQNTVLGQAQSPFILHPNGVYQTLRFNQGWNWFSLFVNTSASGPNDLFSDLTKDSLTVIKDRDNYSQYHSSGWSNEITDLKQGLGYMINVPQNDTIEVYGSVIDNKKIQVAGNGDWTWLGSGDALGSAVSTKLQELKQSDGDIIKSQTGFAVYDDASSSWVGSLHYMEPGDAYKIRTAIPGSITTKKQFKTLPPWDMEYNGFEYNMNITAEIVKADKRVDDSHYLVGAFIDGKCHGIGQPKYSDKLGRFIIYLTAFGDTSNIGKTIDLKLYDTDLGAEIGAKHKAISFGTDVILGTIENPTEIDIGNVGIEDVSFSAHYFTCFPNPFDETLHVVWLPNTTPSKVYLTDMTGRLIKQISSTELSAGKEIYFDTKGLQSGLYFCVAEINGIKVSQKIIKQ